MKFGFLAMAVGAIALLVAACGSSEPEPAQPSVSTKEIAAAVKDAVAESQMSEEQFADMMSDQIARQVADTMSGQIAEQMADMMSDQMTAMAARNPGLSAEEVNAMIVDAVAASNAALAEQIAGMEQGMSDEEMAAMLQAAVDQAVAEAVAMALPESPGELIVYSGRSESLVQPIIDQFAAVTGIEVRVKYANTSEIAATLMEEGSNSPADVFFAQDPGGLGAAASLLDTLPEQLSMAVPDWARSPQEKWVGISGRARVVVYNRESVSPADLPESIEDFADPKWNGRIGWAPSNASFQAMVTAMRVLWGDDRTRQWLENIRDNGAQVYPKNTPIVDAASKGEIDVGFVNHYYLYRFIQEDGEDFGARNYHIPGEGPGSLIMVAGAGILKTAANHENAVRFLEFLLSNVAQQFFAGKTYEYPLVEGVTTHRLLTPLDQITKPAIDMASLEDVQGTQAMLRELGILP